MLKCENVNALSRKLHFCKNCYIWGKEIAGTAKILPSIVTYSLTHDGKNGQFQVTVFSRFCYVLLCNHEYIHCLNHQQAKDYIRSRNKTERELYFERRYCLMSTRDDLILLHKISLAGCKE